MRKAWLLGLIVVVVLATSIILYRRATVEVEEGEYTGLEGVVFLPLPRLKGEVSLEEAIASRRSIRDYLDKPLSLEQLAQLLWAAQGITDVTRSFRAAPSAGATYPLELYVVVGEGGVTGLEAGVYHYDPRAHVLVLVKKGDVREDLARACLNQPWVREAPVSIVIVAVYSRTTARYGDRGVRYVHIEVGHVGQNIYLQATALGLGTVAVGAFYDEEVRKIVGAKDAEHPLYVMPVGVPKYLHKLSIDDLRLYIERYREVYKEG